MEFKTAKDVIKGRWLAVESDLKDDPYQWYKYLVEVC